jgi:D-arginine dehydrogenase
MSEGFDVIVIGGGIAGASLAAELAAHRRVLLVERESQPGYHTTGRSAALLTPFYGNAIVRSLNLAGGRWYAAPPEGFADVPLLGPRGTVYLGREEDADIVALEVEKVRALGGTAEVIDGATVRQMMPILRPEWAVHCWLDRSAADMEVGAILQGYLRLLRRRDGRIRTDAEVDGIERAWDGWRVRLRSGDVSAPVIVNAAGAWADTVAAMAGLGPLGITPMRRTAVIVEAPGHDTRRWPSVADVRETWYAKPEGGKLMCSPADETPSEPCDAQPEELDIAICVDRVQRALDLEIRRIEHSWAGLRSFAPDRTPVCGFDPRAEGFFWLAGQGGYGIMTAPALAAIGAHLITGAIRPEWLGQVDPQALGPQRLLQPERSDRLS